MVATVSPLVRGGLGAGFRRIFYDDTVDGYLYPIFRASTNSQVVIAGFAP